MELGIFAKTFARPGVGDVFDSVAALGLRTVQFNMACAGLPSLPDRIDPGLAERIREAAESRGISIAAVSGTFNLIHPDLAVRDSGLARLRVLAEACGLMGTGVVTLCTGTRDANDMWRAHPDNGSEEAWQDLLAGMESALETAEAFGLTLAVEPETGNVMSSARHARRLLDELESPRLKVVLDPANLAGSREGMSLHALIDEAFELLGSDIVIAHAKELDRRNAAPHGPPGTGLVDWGYFLTCLRDAGYDGPLILHGFEEKDASRAVTFLRDKWKAIANH